MSSTAQPQKPQIVEEAYQMLLQLGGKRFLAMTGSHNLMAAARTQHNPNAWLRMDLVPNQGKVNRMKISLMPDDTYTVEFYHMRLVGIDPIITNEQVHKWVYAEDLQELFTSVTGLDTSL